MIGDIKVTGGSAQPELARDVCEHLGIALTFNVPISPGPHAAVGKRYRRDGEGA